MKLIEELKNRVEALSTQFQEFSSVAHLAIVKERDEQIITLENVFSIVNERKELIYNPQNYPEAPVVAVFLKRFLEESATPLLNNSVKAVQYLRTVKENLSVTYNEYLTQKIPNVVSILQQLMRLSVNQLDLREGTELKNIISQLERIIETEPKEKLKELIHDLEDDQKKEHFWFDLLADQGSLHNYYAYKTKLLQKQFDEKLASLDRLLATIQDKISRPLERRQNLYRRLISLRVDEAAKISSNIFNIIKLEVQPVPEEESLEGSPQISSLEELNQIIDYRSIELGNLVSNLEESFEIWERLKNEEEAFLSSLSNCRKRLDQIIFKFNLPDHTSPLNDVHSFFNEGAEMYAGLCNESKDISSKALEALKKRLSSLREHIDAIDKLIESELWNPFTKMRNSLLIKLGQRINACELLNESLKPLLNSYNTILEYCREEDTLQKIIDGPKSCVEEITEITQMNMKARDIIKRYLNESEDLVFSSIIEEYDEFVSKEGIDIEQLKQKIPNLTIAEILNNVVSLSEKGMISVKLFL